MNTYNGIPSDLLGTNNIVLDDGIITDNLGLQIEQGSFMIFNGTVELELPVYKTSDVKINSLRVSTDVSTSPMCFDLVDAANLKNSGIAISTASGIKFIRRS